MGTDDIQIGRKSKNTTFSYCYLFITSCYLFTLFYPASGTFFPIVLSSGGSDDEGKPESSWDRDAIK
jgi:hypothetical protein